MVVAAAQDTANATQGVAVAAAGFTNPWHSHPCAHGIYVLEGTLNTHQGQYLAGSFVWFPEGGIMEHGATQDPDCTFLFITTKRSRSTSSATRRPGGPEGPERLRLGPQMLPAAS
jgi:quercetin dioxygenase-like cupin family protein